MTIGVTGGSGAIGRHVCEELISGGHTVRNLDRIASESEAAFFEVDLTDLEATRAAVRGCDQIVHLAAIPDPFGGDALETVIGNNTVSAYCVFEAARLEGVRRVVYGCSESSTGFGIHHVKIVPEYLPIDEEHPVWPHESYSLSKHIGERIGANYAKAFGIEVISLRYMWVWTVRAEAAARELAAAAQAGVRPERIEGFGAWIAVRDVARACEASVRYTFPTSEKDDESRQAAGADGSRNAGDETTRGVVRSDADYPFEVFFLAARDTCLPVPSLEIVEANYGELPPVRDPGYFDANPYASVFDIRKAESLLGWTPVGHWRNIDKLKF